MGTDAELFAYGPYHPDLKNNLEYPAEFYADTPEGATIVTLVGFSATSYQSEMMAQALGIDINKFEEHWDIPCGAVDLELLMESFGQNNEQYLCDFLRLKEYGFRFFYRPNG